MPQEEKPTYVRLTSVTQKVKETKQTQLYCAFVSEVIKQFRPGQKNTLSLVESQKKKTF